LSVVGRKIDRRAYGEDDEQQSGEPAISHSCS
jgi:hypothetical protein